VLDKAAQIKAENFNQHIGEKAVATFTLYSARPEYLALFLYLNLCVPHGKLTLETTGKLSR
jgi:hypothetical protein